jgi:hypothetical protein
MEYWNTGKLEYWVWGKQTRSFNAIVSAFRPHYSTIHSFRLVAETQNSEKILFYEKALRFPQRPVNP